MANNLLDVVYLNKRVDFLERAITTVVKDSELKALYLVKDRTKEEVDKNISHHYWRDKLILFLAKRKKNEKEKKLEFKGCSSS